MTREPNPKAFYDTVMPGKLGEDYEAARWAKTPLLRAQYAMTAQTIRAHVVLVLRNAKRILEVGPGPGTWTKILLSENPASSFTLVDISTAMLAQARSALPHDARITFVESDLLGYVPNETFDGFFSSRAIEYMPDKGAVAAKIFSLLAHGASGALITKTPKPFFDRLRGRNAADLHRGQVAPQVLIQALEKAGFQISGVYAATATVPGLNSASLNRGIYWLIKRVPLFFPLNLLTESYCIIFKKP